MTALPADLKRAVENAFHDNLLRDSISPQEREQAAEWYAALQLGAGQVLARTSFANSAKRT